MTCACFYTPTRNSRIISFILDLQNRWALIIHTCIYVADSTRHRYIAYTSQWSMTLIKYTFDEVYIILGVIVGFVKVWFFRLSIIPSHSKILPFKPCMLIYHWCIQVLHLKIIKSTYTFTGKQNGNFLLDCND